MRLAGIAAADGLMQRIEEARAGRFKHSEQFFFALGERFDERPLLREQRQLVGKEKRDAAVALADRLDAGPRHFAGGNQRVEAGGCVVGDARGQNRSLKQRCGQRRALQVLDRIEQRIEMRRPAAARREQALPVREEARQRVLLHRLHFAAQPGQRLAADLAQNLRVAPFAMQAAGTESAFEHAAFMRKLPQRILHRFGIQRKALRRLAQRERPMRARVAAHQFQHRVRHRLEQRNGKSRRQRNAQRIAIARRIFRGNQPLFAGDAQFEQAPRANQPVNTAQADPRSATRRASSSRDRSPSRRQRS